MDRNPRRMLLTDLGVVVATGAWSLVLRHEASAGDFAWPGARRLAVELAITAVALAVLRFRHGRPLLVALLVLPLSVSAFAVVPAFVALYTLAAHHERTTAILVGAGYVAASLLGSAITEPPDAWLPWLLTLTAFCAAPVAFGMVRHARLALLDELQERAVRAEAEQHLRVDRARRAERQRIAREMHDVVAHRISLVSLHAGALAYRPDASPDEVHAAEVIRASAHEALEELRGVIGILRDDAEGPEPERPQPTLRDVPDLVDRCRAAGTRLVVHDHTGDRDDIPPAVGRTAYRVVEEVLTNAAKHARGAKVEVTIDGRGEHALVIEAVNPVLLRATRRRDAPARGSVAAPSGPAIPGAGAGLIGLEERVALVGGDLRHGPTGDGRFRLRAEIPWTP